MGKKEFILPLAIAVLALGVRLVHINDGIIFGYDQARDAYRVTSFIQDLNPMLLGPETDIPGVHHGVGFYYLLAIPYAISESPVAATVFFVIFHAAFSVLLYQSLNNVFRSKSVAIATSVLFAVSFEMVQYSRWLSNPQLGTLSMFGMWYYLVRYTRGDKRALLWAFFFAGLSIHFQLFLLYAGLFVLLTPLFFRKYFSPVQYVKGMIVYALFLLPFAVSEIRFRGQMSESFLAFLGNSRVYHGPIDILTKIAARMESVISHVLVPGYQMAALLVFLLALTYVLFQVRSGKTPAHMRTALMLLLGWHLVTYSVYLFSSGAVATEFSFVGGVMSILVIVGFAAGHLMETAKFRWTVVAVYCLLLALNFYASVTRATLGSYLFSVQEYLTYGLEKDIVDYVYGGAGSQEKFSICTLTNPFYVNTTWAYIFSTYGQGKYGYVPYWAGSSQSNYLGGNDLLPDTGKPALRYLIYEPPAGMPDYMPAFFGKIESFISNPVETKYFGDFIVDKRRLKSEEELAKNRTNSEYQKELEGGTLFSCYN